MEYGYIAVDLHPGQNNYHLGGFFQRCSSEEQFGINEVKLKIVWLKTIDSDLVFVSLDTLYFPESIACYIYDYFYNNFNVSSECIICNATHTHSAPNLSMPIFGMISENYINDILKILGTKLRCLDQVFKPCALSFNEIYNVNGSTIGRRRLARNYSNYFLKKSVMMLPNPKQKIDDKIRLLAISNLDGEIEGVIYNFSCHPVFAKNKQISSDFPGMVNSNLEKDNIKFAIFLQGFCGDVRPNVSGNSIFEGSLIDRVKALIYGNYFRTISSLELVDYSSKWANKISSNLRSDSSEIHKITNHSFLFSFISATGKVEKESIIKLIVFNNVIGVSISAEVLSTYYQELKDSFPCAIIFPLGFAENILGYLPTHNQIPEGGYEVTSATNYGWDAHLDQENLNIFLKELKNHISYVLNESKK